MKNYLQIDSWYTCVEKIKSLFNIKKLYGLPDKAGLMINKIIKSKFDRFFLDEINKTKIGADGLDHSKLRFYKNLKGSFRIEPYIEYVKNRNQRHWLSRYRTSAHSLRIELGRYASPITHLLERICRYCHSGECDEERHFILYCDTFRIKRQCFFGRLASLHASFLSLSDEHKLSFILCPPTSNAAKCVSKFLGIMTNTRKEIDGGLCPDNLNLYIKHKADIP